MFKKLLTVSFLLVFMSSFLFAQDKGAALIKPNGEIIKKYKSEKALQEVIPVKQPLQKKLNKMFSKSAIGNGLTDTPDTLDYEVPIASNFGFFGQDVMVTWFKCPADLTVKAVAFNTYENLEETSADVKLVRLNWSEDRLMSYSSATQLGYYEDSDGPNGINAFENLSDGEYVDSTADQAGSPFGEDIWSDNGAGYPVTPEGDLGSRGYTWVPMNVIGEPDLQRGDIFGVVLTNLGGLSGNVDQSNRIGFDAGGTAYPGLKFYANGRSADAGATDMSSAGWWVRPAYTWDFIAAVVLTGDIAPQFNSYSVLPTTLSTDDRTVEANVTDINPSGGGEGVDNVTLYWTTDSVNNTYNEVAMSGSEPDFSGVIPGQQPGTEVFYYLSATDVEGNVSETVTHNYRIFKPTEGINTLLVFNGYTEPAGYPQSYYFGHDDFTAYSVVDFPHDSWSYGPLTAELVNNYTNILEITTTGPLVYNDDVIRTWLEADASHNYMLAGQEYLGARYGYADMDFAEGDFEFDVLGVTHSYNDVSYDGEAGQGLPSLVLDQAGSDLGDSLSILFTSQETDSLQYDPVFENGGIYNWVDGFDVQSGQEVNLRTETRGIAGEPAVDTFAIATNREMSAGNKISFMSYDPISINSAPDYYWYGFSSTSIQVQTLDWFGIPRVTSVERKDEIPEKYALSQNYPNPFNPSTKIEFTIPNKAEVTLKVYDILGREVTTLVNNRYAKGTFEVSFNASDLASGMYIYKLKAGDCYT